MPPGLPTRPLEHTAVSMRKPGSSRTFPRRRAFALLRYLPSGWPLLCSLNVVVEGYPMFERILVPLDGSPLSELILAQIARILRCEDSEILLLRVLDIPESIGRVSFSTLRVSEREAAQKYLDDTARRLAESQQATGCAESCRRRDVPAPGDRRLRCREPDRCCGLRQRSPHHRAERRSRLRLSARTVHPRLVAHHGSIDRGSGSTISGGSTGSSSSPSGETR